jgi:hypothetical protein
MDALRSSKALGEMGIDPRFASVFDPKADPNLRMTQVDQFLDAYFYDKRVEKTGPHKMPSGQIRPGGQPTFRLVDLIRNFNDEKLMRAAQRTEGFNIQKLIDNLGPNGAQYLHERGYWDFGYSGSGPKPKRGKFDPRSFDDMMKPGGGTIEDFDPDYRGPTEKRWRVPFQNLDELHLSAEALNELAHKQWGDDYQKVLRSMLPKKSADFVGHVAGAQADLKLAMGDKAGNII